MPPRTPRGNGTNVSQFPTPEGYDDVDAYVNVGESRPLGVEQGPVELVSFLYGGPDWAVPVLLAACVVVVGLGMVGYRRHGDLDVDVLEEMLKNLIALLTFGGAAWLVTTVSPVGYLVDLVVSVAMGAGCWYAVMYTGGVRALAERIAESPPEPDA
jgi:hypothetical protein